MEIYALPLTRAPIYHWITGIPSLSPRFIQRSYIYSLPLSILNSQRKQLSWTYLINYHKTFSPFLEVYLLLLVILFPKQTSRAYRRISTLAYTI